MDWSPYGVRPTGNRKTRRFEVTQRTGVTIQGKHYGHGDEISQRQALNLKYNRDAGWDSRSEYERESQRRDFREWTSQSASRLDRSTAKQRAANSDFSKAWVKWKRSGYSRKGKPGQPFADFLEDIDYREDDAPYPVGETPNAQE